MTEGKGMKAYKLHREIKERADGHNPGALGIDGWKSISKTELRRLYRAGKVSVGLGMAYGVTMGDHVAMLETCHTPDEFAKRLTEIGEAGVNLETLERVRKGMETRTGRAAEARAKATRAAKATSTLVIKRKSGVVRTVQAKATKPQTAHQKAVAQAVALAEHKAAEKKAREAKGKAGFDVHLSPEAETALLVSLQPTAIEIK